MRGKTDGILQEYNDIFDKIAYCAHTHDFDGIRRGYWKLHHLLKKRIDLPVIQMKDEL